MLTAGAKSPHEALLLSGMSPNHTAIRMGNWKLHIGGNEKNIELYNLEADIGEKNNLAATNPEKVKELQDRLNALMKDAVPKREPGDPEEAGKAKNPGGKKRRAK